MIYYFASKNDNLKSPIPLASIGKSKNQHCHKTIKEAVIYMINPREISPLRCDLNELFKSTNCNISFFLYKCEVLETENFSYNKTKVANIISKTFIKNAKEFLNNL